MSDQERRAELYSLLGDLPARDHPLSARTVSVETRESYILERLLFDLNGREAVPAYLARPKAVRGRAPAVLYNHAHGGRYDIGKEELLSGREAFFQKPSYAEVLTGMGYCVLCVDTWLFGERGGRTESEVFKEMLWSGQVLWGMMVYDGIRALDYLLSRPEVDPSRVATMGLSMGSTMAWWLAALDPRIKVCVDLCCMTDYQALVATRGLDRHGIYYYVPGLLKHFSTAQINSLIAPRPHLATAGRYDLLTPGEGLDRIDRELKRVYGEAGAADAWTLTRYDCGHMETAAMRQEVVEYLKRWL